MIEIEFEETVMEFLDIYLTCFISYFNFHSLTLFFAICNYFYNEFDGLILVGTNQGDEVKLNEIARMLRELKEEQNRWIASDDKLARETNSKPGQTASSGSTSSAHSTSSSSAGSNATSSAQEIVLFSDDDVQIRVNAQMYGSAGGFLWNSLESNQISK